MCRHYWRYAGSLNRAQCRLCGIEVERAEPDKEGPWRIWRVALNRAMR